MTGGNRHVAPHRLADALAGRMSDRERGGLERHLARCARCAGAARRLARARAAMDGIAGAEAPELAWEQIGVRLYWETSSARHAAQRGERRSGSRRRGSLALAGAGLLAVATGAVAVFLALGGGRADTAAPARPAMSAAADTAAAPDRAAAPAPPARLRGVVTFARGAVLVDGRQLDTQTLFDKPIGAGTRLDTGEGRVVVQFGARSGFALEPGSSVNLRRFDEGGVELEVDGVIEVDLTRRPPGQLFEVRAGQHRVVVHGTAFRVDHRGGALDVSCARGRVMVKDGEREVALDAGQRLQLLEDVVLAHALREQIDPARLAELEESLAAPLLPAWTQPRALFETSSLLDVVAAPGHPVRLDGVEVGSGTFAVRVMSGRHQVQVANRSGAFGAGAWIVAAAGARQAARGTADGMVRVLDPARLGAPDASVEAAAAEERRAGRRARRAQLAAALERNPRAMQCVQPLEKRDLVSGSFVVLDVGVNADGSQGHLNIAESNVPVDVERCLRRLVDSVELPPGPAATVRYKLAFE